MNHQLTLYHYWRSSCSWRVRWALALKQVDYKSLPINLLQNEQAAAAYTAKNPTGFVPCLEIDGQGFGESLALIEWIDETWRDPPLLPKDPLQRLRARQLAMIVASGIQPLQNLVPLKRFVAEDETDAAAKRQAHARYFIERGLAVYESLLADAKSSAYSIGDQISIADLCLIPQMYNARRFNVAIEQYHLSFAIFERCLQTPACEKAAPHNQEGAS